MINKFYVANSIEFMRERMNADSIDLTVTSPPYDNLRITKGINLSLKIWRMNFLG